MKQREIIWDDPQLQLLISNFARYILAHKIKLLLNAKETADMLGIGTTLFYKLAKKPSFPKPVTLSVFSSDSPRVLWRLKDLIAYLDTLPPLVQNESTSEYKDEDTVLCVKTPDRILTGSLFKMME